jgi:hypothetical protein
MPNERALSGFVRVGQVNIEHETGVVKNHGALFRCSGVACAVASLHVAPTEVECVDYSKSNAKTVVHGSNVRPCYEAYDLLLSSLCPPAPAGINGTTDHGAIANECQAMRRFANCSEPCQGVAWHPCSAQCAGEATEAECWRPATQMPARQLGRRTIRYAAGQLVGVPVVQVSRWNRYARQVRQVFDSSKRLSCCSMCAKKTPSLC